MSQNVEFVLDAKEAGAVRAWLAVQRGAEAYAGSVGKIDLATVKMEQSGQADARMKREVLAIMSSTETATEKLTRKTSLLDQAVKTGVISGDQYRTTLDRLHDEMDEGDTHFSGLSSRLAIVTKGFAAGAAAAGAFAQAVRDAQRGADDAADTIDDSRKKWATQTGLQGEELDASFQTIEANAIRNGVSPQQAYTSATQLASSGAKPEVAAGGGLNEFLRGLAAMNAGGKNVDQRAMAEATISYLTSQKIEATPENIRNSIQRSQRLFMGTNFQAPDLAELAKKGSALRTAITPEEQFAGMSVYRDVGLPGSEAATSLSNVTSRLQTAGASKDKVAALKRLGLKAEQVDFVGPGEDLDSTIAKIDAGLQRVPEKDRAGLQKTLFEEAGVKDFRTLADNRDKFQAAMETQKGAEAYEADADRALQGRGPALQRTQTEALLVDAERGRREGLDKVSRQAASIELKNRGVSDLMRNVAVDGNIPFVSQFTGPMSVFDLMRSLPEGMAADPKRAAEWGTTTGTMFLGACPRN